MITLTSVVASIVALLVYLVLAASTKETSKFWVPMLKRKAFSNMEIERMYSKSITAGETAVEEVFGSLVKLKQRLSPNEMELVMEYHKDFKRAILGIFTAEDEVEIEENRKLALKVYEKIRKLKHQFDMMFINPYYM